MVIAAAPAISLGPPHCHFCHEEGIGCLRSYAVNRNWIKSPFEGQRVTDNSCVSFRSGNPVFGPNQFHWLPLGRESCLSKVSVAADYSDSVPDSSNYVRDHGYHPLEELKVRKRVRETKLTSAEIARTTVEANGTALLMFPGMIHSEPHEHISWAEFQYVIDEFGDIYFEIFDNENILQDPGASNPVNALFGMDITTYENRRVTAAEYNFSDGDTLEDTPFIEDCFEVDISEVSDVPVEADISSSVHPIYFAKCLAKSVNMEYAKRMDHPSNGVSILGCLRPVFIDEELHLRRLFNGDDSDGYTSDWKDGETWSFSSKGDGDATSSTFYRLEIMRIKLFSVYGVQSTISLQEFQYAEPDFLVHSIPTIAKDLSEKGSTGNFALKALCKKKGLHVEGAILIGVDSLGMDVRVFSGVEVRTHRFPFKARATTEVAAERQIHQLLFPRSRRKKLRTLGDGLRDQDFF